VIFARPGLGLGQLAGYPYVTWGLGGQVEVSISVGMSDSRGYHYHTSSGPGIHTGMLSAEDGIHRYLITVLIGMHEPAAGMNHSETESLMKMIEKIQKEHHMTILLIEHDMKLVMGICEKIAVLDYGVKIADGLRL
jgi:hypothetical protein